jgi:hypothetical protein
MRSVAIAVVLGLFLVSSSSAHAEEMSVLNNVSTSVLGGRTRVVFQFGGDVRFSTEQTKNGVRIVFSRTRAASMQVLNRRVLNAGPLEGIGFQRPAMDSIIAVLAFVNGSTYRCVCPASGNELVVDVNGSAAVRQTSIPKPVAAPKTVQTQPAAAPVVASNQPASAEPARTATGSSLIDIPGLAKRQMELENAGDARRTGEPVQYSALLLVIVSVAVSLAVTALAMLFIVKMMRREPAPVTAAPVVPAQVASIAAKVSAYQQKPLVPQDEAEEDDDDMKPEPDRIRALFNAPMREEEPEEDAGRETSLQLARTFRRGSEEITLARKFHERPSPALTPAKMQTAMARATTKSQRLNAARKLGVGRGEFDLAQKLKTMSQHPEKNEEEKA